MDVAGYVAEQRVSSHWTGRMPQYQELLRESIAEAAQMMDTAKGKRVLDAGCGDGWSLGEWARHGCKPVGLDISTEKARAAAEAGYTVAVAMLGRDRLLWPDGSFDFIFCSHTLEHVPPEWQARAASELCRIAKPGAPGLVIVPYGRKRSPGHRTYFDREDKLPALLRGGGFTVLEAELRTRLEPEQWVGVT